MNLLPIVEYKAEDNGQVIERFFHSMKKAPRAVWDGPRRFARCVISTSMQIRTGFKPYVAYSKPRNLPGTKTLPNGRSVIETRAQEREIAKVRGEVWT